MYRGGGDIHQAMLAQERKKEQGALSPREGWLFKLCVLLQAPLSSEESSS